MGPFRDGWTEADVEAVLARGDPEELLHVPIVVSLSPPDCSWAEGVCVRLASHPHPAVRANAVLGLGHLARVCRRVDEAAVRPVIDRALADADAAVRGKAQDAADDLEWYVGLTFARREDST
jgi:hypothetical protein